MTSSIEAVAETRALDGHDGHGENNDAHPPPPPPPAPAPVPVPVPVPATDEIAKSNTPDENANASANAHADSNPQPSHDVSSTAHITTRNGFEADDGDSQLLLQSQLPPATSATTTNQDLSALSLAPALLEHYMPSPPTVSPLSTPAFTAIHSTNGDYALDDDLPKLADDQIITATLPPFDQSLLAQSVLPDLEQSFPSQQTPSQGYAAVATTDNDTNYPSHSLNTGRMSRSNTLTDIDPAAFMIALAQNANGPQIPPDYPTAIAPSEISLAASQGQDDGTFESASASASRKLESFARIEFADSVFQMTTYAVIIGRDQRAMEQARKDERRATKYKDACDKAEMQGLPPPTPMGRDRGKFSKSYVSEEGGILGPESDGGDSRKAPSQHDDADVNNDLDDNTKSNNLQYVSHSEGAAAVDLSNIQPSTYHVPFVGIHSPGPSIAARTKGISRQHLKIQFSEKRGVFLGIALHKNGFFCDDIHYGIDDPVTMRSGSRLQIKDVEFFFVINGVENGKTGAEDMHDGEEASSKRCSVGGKEMSLEFEHSDQEHKKKFLRDTDSPSPARNAKQLPPSISEDDYEESAAEILHEAEGQVAAPHVEDIEDMEDMEDMEGLERLQALDDADDFEGMEELLAADDQSELVGDDPILPYMDAATAAALLQSVERGEELPPDFIIPRRRGPGRPPKDGIMSKRERRLLKKQLEAHQTSQKTLPQEPAGEKIKRPVGRPRKTPLPEDADRPEKRKYTKRAKEGGEEGSDAERRSKEKKDKKVRPKSPPLDLKIEDYTHEQLKKPAKNYVHLIDEALQAGPSEGLSLKQIYKRITAAYPWYYFSAETKGWESSVRHNLIGNDGFKKHEETGLWQRVHGIDLDAGKKRKAPTPERQLGSMHQMGQQAYYHHPTYMQQGTLQFADGLPGNSISNSQQHQNYAQPATGQTNQHYAGSQAAVNGQIAHAPQMQMASSSQLAVAPGTPVPRQAGQQGTYSSPYARSGSATNTQFNGGTPSSNLHGQHSHLPQPAAQNSRPQAGILSMAAVPKGALGNPDDNHKVVTFKESMMKMLSSLNISHAKIQQLVETAINKAFGLPALPTLSGFEKVEARLTNEVLKILEKEPIQVTEPPVPTPAPAPAPATVSTPVTTPAILTAQASSPAPPPPPKLPTPGPKPNPAPSAAETEIESALTIFRNNFMKTFRSKCAQADYIMESAVNQARGLPNAGKVKGWEQVNDLLVTEVTKIINNVQKKYSSQQDSAASPAQLSQASPGTAMRQGHSASPAPGQSAASFATMGAPTPAMSASSGLALARPPASAVRPAIARPGAVSVARPLVNRLPSGVAHQAAPLPPPASALQNQAQTHTQAQPQAQKQPPAVPAAPLVTASFTPGVQGTPAGRPLSTSVPTAPSTIANNSSSGLHDAPIPKTISPLPQVVTQPPLAKTASPAPPPTTKPSAGVMEQIMGQGQKRSLESLHGPGSDITQQPEVKKLVTSAPSTA